MRLLLRANSHQFREDTGLELVSSPDTVGREQWQWHLRLDDPGTTQSGNEVSATHTTLARGDGSVSTATLSTDPARVTGQVETIDVDATSRLEREERELVTLVVGSGRVLVEHRHELNELDVLVLEGDDPYEVSVEPLEGAHATLVVARLEPVDAMRIAWVP